MSLINKPIFYSNGAAPPMDCARAITVIETTLTRRGDGKDDPIRVVTQYWDMNGNLLAEVDPTLRT